MPIALRFVLILSMPPVLIFASAGRVDLPVVWAWIGVLVAAMLVGYCLMDPGLRKERIRPAPGGLDRRLRFAVMPFFLGHLVFAGLDLGRLHLSDTVPTALRVAGVVGYALSMGLTVWAMLTNRFFSPVVRIQAERGHRLVTGGPYRLMRHPGYLGGCGSMIFGGLALGSWWALAPLVIPFALMIRRAKIEDRFLHENLDGYREYAAQRKWRLMPGVW